MTILYLVCSSEAEAEKITDILLEKKLIACAKKLSAKSVFKWQGKLNKADEVLLLLETEENLFDAIEKEVRQIHGHKVFVMASIPVGRTSRGVAEWLREELGDS